MVTENAHVGSHILTEVSGLSRDDVVIASGKHAVATVMGTVTADNELVQLNPGASDGSEVASAILYRAVDASETAKKDVANTRLTAVRATSLVWPEGITDGEKATALGQLSAKHIVAR